MWCKIELNYKYSNKHFFLDPPEGVEVEGAGQKLLAGEETSFTCYARNASGALTFRSVFRICIKHRPKHFIFYF